MSKELTYIGAILPAIPSNNFASSLFLNGEDQYLIQQINDEGKIFFKPIPPPNLIRKTNDPFIVKENANYIYSFTTIDNELYYGTKDVIEQDLLNLLLTKSSFNVHTKLIISSFLQLHTHSLSLIKLANENLQKNKILSEIDENLLFTDSKTTTDDQIEFYSELKDRYNSLRSISSSLKITDLALIHEDKVYFNNYKFEFTQLFKSKIQYQSEIKLILCELISTSYSKKQIDLEKLIFSNENAYVFLLGCDDLEFKQSDIEGFLSSEIPNNTQSVIEVGLKVDKELLTDLPRQKVSRNDNLEKELQLTNSVIEITKFTQRY